VWASACFIFHLKNKFLSDKTGFWYDDVGILNQMIAMVVGGDGTSGGWKKRVVACLLNRFQASNPPL